MFYVPKLWRNLHPCFNCLSTNLVFRACLFSILHACRNTFMRTSHDSSIACVEPKAIHVTLTLASATQQPVHLCKKNPVDVYLICPDTSTVKEDQLLYTSCICSEKAKTQVPPESKPVCSDVHLEFLATPFLVCLIW